ncbi:MAG TPA: DUF3107 domain-containing protein [Acidimicrobiia bacterium]|nr:DUF3107 domain-containing protein [Acidimicrobiia bacterium]
MPSTTPAKKTRVKIGITYAPREIDIDVTDGEAFMEEFEQVVTGADKVWWISDQEGHRHGIVVDKIAYVDVEPERERMVGFGST